MSYVLLSGGSGSVRCGYLYLCSIGVRIAASIRYGDIAHTRGENIIRSHYGYTGWLIGQTSRMLVHCIYKLVSWCCGVLGFSIRETGYQTYRWQARSVDRVHTQVRESKWAENEVECLHCEFTQFSKNCSLVLCAINRLFNKFIIDKLKIN